MASRDPVSRKRAAVTVELSLLGPPLLAVNSRPVRVHSVKIFALLAYLVLEEGPHSRDKLAALLWGETSDARARQSLRQALYSLRRALGDMADPLLAVDPLRVAYQPDETIDVDLQTFLTIARSDTPSRELLQVACSLYRGLLLEGVTLDDCPAYEEWLYLRRESLQREACRLLRTLADRQLAGGDPAAARATAERLLALDPLDEGAYRRLLRASAALGERDDVRRVYEQCRAVLLRELNVQPEEKTQHLYEQLLNNAAQHGSPRPQPAADGLPGEAIPPVPASLAGDLDELPFVGQAQPLERLQEHLNRLQSGHGGRVLVTGEAGLGKTRLLRELVRRTHSTTTGRLLWLYGQCYEAELQAPYALWSDLLQPLTSAAWRGMLAAVPPVWLAQLGHLVPEIAPLPEAMAGVTAAESRLRLFQGVVQTLGSIARGQPLVLIFEDLQWADASSLALLSYVARHLSGEQLLMILTWRPEEAAGNPALSRLHSGPVGDVAVLRLEPLRLEDLQSLLADHHLNLSATALARLHQFSHGNPFVVSETIQVLATSEQPIEAGPLRLFEDSIPLPSSVNDLIRARLALLNEEQRFLLGAAAVPGRPFSLALLSRIVDRPQTQLLGELPALTEHAFLRESDDSLARPRLMFRHEYQRRVIYDGLGSVHRHLFHSRAADALLEAQRQGENGLNEEIAYHYVQVGDARALTYLTEAAEGAQARHAFAHAVALVDRALTFLASVLPEDSERRFELLNRKLILLEQQGRHAEQGETVAELLSLAATIDDPRRLAIAYTRQASLLTHREQFAEARRAAVQARQLYQVLGDLGGEAEVLRELGFVHWQAQDYGTALQFGREALHLYRRAGDTVGEASALHNLAEIYRGLGSPQQAMDGYRQALELYWSVNDQRRQGLTLYGMAKALRQAGDEDGAFRQYNRALDHCQAVGDILMESRVYHALGSLYWATGAPERALDALTAAEQLSRHIGYAPGIAHALVATGMLYAHRGEPAEATPRFEEAVHWLRLTEDERMADLLAAKLDELTLQPVDLGRFLGNLDPVRSHVILSEGKVYCEFESPLAWSAA